jgi:predicted HTH transcriptional regulator
MSEERNHVPTDEELISLLRAGEDDFTERKSLGDWHKDIHKTLIAFANTRAVGLPSMLFIGVKNNGVLEGLGEKDVDSIQQRINDYRRQILPPVQTFCRIIHPEGKRVLAVIVPGSANRPHVQS